MSVDPVLVLVLRLGLAALFGAAAAHKLRDPAAFRSTLRDYRIAPPAWSAPLAACVVAAEVAVAGLLLLGRAGAPGALALLLAYSAAIGLNLARGRRHIDCGCLGPGRRQPLSPWLLARNAALAAAALATLAPVQVRPLLWMDALSVAAALGTVVLLWNAVHSLASLPQRSP